MVFYFDIPEEYYLVTEPLDDATIYLQVPEEYVEARRELERIGSVIESNVRNLFISLYPSSCTNIICNSGKFIPYQHCILCYINAGICSLHSYVATSDFRPTPLPTLNLNDPAHPRTCYLCRNDIHEEPVVYCTHSAQHQLHFLCHLKNPTFTSCGICKVGSFYHNMTSKIEWMNALLSVWNYKELFEQLNQLMAYRPVKDPFILITLQRLLNKEITKDELFEQKEGEEKSPRVVAKECMVGCKDCQLFEFHNNLVIASPFEYPELLYHQM